MRNRLETPREVSMVVVIRVVAARGYGTEADPIRLVTQYWSEDGELLAESDPCRKEVAHA
jgi:hypothetical protein